MGVLQSPEQTDAVLLGRDPNYWTTSPVNSLLNAQFNEHLTMYVNGNDMIDQDAANNEQSFGLRYVDGGGTEAFEIFPDPNRPVVDFRFPE